MRFKKIVGVFAAIVFVFAVVACDNDDSATPSPSAAPATDAPATDAPATDAPATAAPATDAPATDAPA
jgi:hypothetical protein